MHDDLFSLDKPNKQAHVGNFLCRYSPWRFGRGKYVGEKEIMTKITIIDYVDVLAAPFSVAHTR